MTTLLLVLLFGALALVLLDGNWRAGLLVMLLIGFLQDPIRKLVPNQPGYLVGLALVAFVAVVLVFYQQRQRLELPLMLRTTPELREWLLLFVLLVLLQAVNSFVRFGIPQRSLIGIGFYFAPLVGIWMGFQLGRDQPFLRRFLQVYLLGSAVIAATVFLDYRGVDIPLFREVGGGILIHFRYGFYTYGSSGLWRTSELASWHLSASACLALVMGFACLRPQNRNLWFLLSFGFAFLTLTTGRRKGLVLVLVFAALYLLLFSRTAPARSRSQIITALLGSAGLAFGAYNLFLIGAAGDDFVEYLNRALSARDDLVSRFQAFAVNAAWQGLQSSGGIGLGAGTLAQTGDLQVQQIDHSAGVGNVVLVSESGVGKVLAELGIPGLIVLSALGLLLARLILRHLNLLRYLPSPTSNLELGLLSFGLANIPFFSAAAGVYGDPFVLMLCGLSFGSFFAVPALVLHRQQLLHRPQLLEAHQRRDDLPLMQPSAGEQPAL